jgi:hypothetical protein
MPLITAERARKLILDECETLGELLLEKDAKYGNSVFAPVHIFAKADPCEQIAGRIDDKLARVARGNGALEDEDVTADLIGYLVLYRIALREARRNAGLH